ncbi:hypothetical protein QM042_02055 [Escherichia coli]|uniref:hypothetical protein n=1 Tax=Escherichia coli TaxID=562 RepID=UPI003986EFEC
MREGKRFEVIRVVSNAVNALISGEYDDGALPARVQLSYEVEAGDWKGTSTMFNWSEIALQAGLAERVAANLLRISAKSSKAAKEKKATTSKEG